MTTGSVTPGQVKACCAATYGADLVALLLGDAYHPGGLALTRGLSDLLALSSDERVLDVASGRGTTALMLAHEYGVQVDGVDLSEANVGRARAAVDAAGLAARPVFTTGDAEALPYPDAVFDAVMCECAFCIFPDKPTAARELARVLRPGGRLGIADMVADPRRLPAGLAGLTAWVACVADARPIAEYAALLSDAGLHLAHVSRHDSALSRMIDQIEARLAVLRMTARDGVEALGVDFERAPAVLAAARAAVADGVLGYAILTAGKPGRPS
jgi:SAM-dependent methyltransferase